MRQRTHREIVQPSELVADVRDEGAPGLREEVDLVLHERHWGRLDSCRGGEGGWGDGAVSGEV